MNTLQKFYVEKWVKALRSGKYKQGRNVLKRGDHFCCLGVLCDIAMPMLKQRGYKDVGWTETDDAFKVKGEHAADLNLPDVLADLVGIECSGKVKRTLPKKARNLVNNALNLRDHDLPAHHSTYDSLSNLNDKGVPFETIADIIEKFPNTFFKNLPE